MQWTNSFFSLYFSSPWTDRNKLHDLSLSSSQRKLQVEWEFLWPWKSWELAMRWACVLMILLQEKIWQAFSLYFPFRIQDNLKNLVMIESLSRSHNFVLHTTPFLSLWRMPLRPSVLSPYKASPTLYLIYEIFPPNSTIRMTMAANALMMCTANDRCSFQYFVLFKVQSVSSAAHIVITELQIPPPMLHMES